MGVDMEGMNSHNFGMITSIHEYILQTQVMTVQSKLLRLVLRRRPRWCRWGKPLHHPHPSRHLPPHGHLPVRQMGHQERRPLHPSIIAVHRIPRALPLLLALLQIPLVALIALVPRHRPQLVVPRRADLIRVEVDPVRRGLPRVLLDHARGLALRARGEVGLRRGPRPAINLARVCEVAAVRAKEGPGHDGADVEVRLRGWRVESRCGDVYEAGHAGSR